MSGHQHPHLTGYQNPYQNDLDQTPIDPRLANLIMNLPTYSQQVDASDQQVDASGQHFNASYPSLPASNPSLPVPSQSLPANVAAPNFPPDPNSWTYVQQYVEMRNAPIQLNANDSETWSIIRFRISDGMYINPPVDKVNEAGEHIFYVPVDQDSKPDVQFRQSIAEKLAAALEIRPLAGTRGIMLEAWPIGYSMLRRVKGMKSRNQIDLTNIRGKEESRRVDNHLFGHPKGGSYDHQKKAAIHLSWLARGGGPGPCECGKCGKNPTQPYLL